MGRNARLTRIGALVVPVALVVLAACSSAGGGGVAEPTRPASAQVIAQREDVLVLPTGDGRAVAFGGVTRDGREYTGLRDGAIADLASGRSTPLALAPKPALGHLTGTVSGRRLLVAGTECVRGTEPLEDLHASPPCPEARVGIRGFDLRTSKWDLDADVPAKVLGNATSASAVGQAGPTIVVLAYVIDGRHERGVVLGYDTESDRWARAPQRTLGQACWTGGAMVSLRPSRLAVWRPGAEQWKFMRLPATLGAAADPHLRCTANYAVVDSWPPAGRPGHLGAYAPATGAWTDLPPKPRFVPGFSVVSVGDHLAYWNDVAPVGDDLDLHVLDVAAPARGWVDRGRVPNNVFDRLARVAGDD